MGRDMPTELYPKGVHVPVLAKWLAIALDDQEYYKGIGIPVMRRTWRELDGKFVHQPQRIVLNLRLGWHWHNVMATLACDLVEAYMKRKYRHG